MTDSPASTSRQRVTVSIGWLYVLSGLGVSFLCVTSIVLLTVFRPMADNTSLDVIIVGFSTTTLASIIAALKSQEAKHLTREFGYRVNGRLDALVDETAKRERLEGRVEGAGLAATAAQTEAAHD